MTVGFDGLTTQSGSGGAENTPFASYIQDPTNNGTISAANFVDAEAAYGALSRHQYARARALMLLNNGETFPSSNPSVT